MFCKYCGTRLDDVQNFCGVCGRAVDRNIKFADSSAKRLDDVAESSAAIAEETVAAAVEEATEEVVEEIVEEAVDDETETVEEPESVSLDEIAPVKLTGLKVGLLVWTMINMMFGMYPFTIPALIMNIRASRMPEGSSKKSIECIKVLNFSASLLLALVVFYCVYMTLFMYSGAY